ncbi:MAG: hypothetical protein Q4F41_18075 [Eubacteriales bacterium]|nr:hypothetical protein [Eubacteriales bacterium]
MRYKGKRFFIFFCLLLFLPSLPVQAGNINGYEADVLHAASGDFEYEGNLYRATPEYLDELEAELSKDEINLTAEEAAQYTVQLYGSLEERIAEGSLRPAEEFDPETGEWKNETKKEKKKYLAVAGLALFTLFLVLCLNRWICGVRRVRTARKKGIVPLYDIHCHILPGVDDGAPDEATALEMLGVEYRQGIRRIILTPHYRAGHRNCRKEKLFEVFERLRQAAKEAYPDLTLALGNEIEYKEGVLECLEAKKALTLGDGRYVLVEFHPEDSYRVIFNACMKLIRAGYTPVIAHAERYPDLFKKEAHLKELQQSGVLMQMNYESVSRFRKYLKKGYIDLLATDAHDLERRTPTFQKALNILYKSCSTDHLRHMMIKMPERIWPQDKTEKGKK